MRMNEERWKRLIKEFSRYLVVGGTAFLVDYGVLFLFGHYVFQNLGDMGVYLATALGFLAAAAMAAGESPAAVQNLADRHIARGLKCESCHADAAHPAPAPPRNAPKRSSRPSGLSGMP